jgi:DNA-binding CsgD family transcriptional regulator
MISRPIQEIQNVAGDKNPSTEVQSLVAQLVNIASDLIQIGIPADADHQEVILDEEVNGVRCLLLRVHAKNDRAHLSPREQEIARMVAEGYPNKTIAAVLDISSWTVCTHMRRIFAKLNVRSRAAMVARLVEERVIGEQFRHDDM